MKVIPIAIEAPPATEDLIHLTPELLAAVGARTSREARGVQHILNKIGSELTDRDAAVDKVFKFIDYGHRSIEDMAPVAIFIEGISLILAYHLFAQCLTAGGQESSTRYIDFSQGSFLIPEEFHPQPERIVSEYAKFVSDSMCQYNMLTEFWQRWAHQEIVEEDTSKRARLIRNAIFDRARYALPVTLKTNVVLVQSARAWVDLCIWLYSHPCLEFNNLGAALRIQLRRIVPRLVKHAVFKKEWAEVALLDFEERCRAARDELDSEDLTNPKSMEANNFSDFCNLDIKVGPLSSRVFCELPRIATKMPTRTNRYTPLPDIFKRVDATFSITNLAFAELRDLNRHRTGNKYTPLIPVGVYCAADQTPQEGVSDIQQTETLLAKHAAQANRLLLDGDPRYIYWTNLGTQFYFEHGLKLDKLIYEIELRTGAGAHYRYRDHMLAIAKLLFKQIPELKGKLLLGSGGET